jgi:ribonuclease P protein component
MDVRSLPGDVQRGVGSLPSVTSHATDKTLHNGISKSEILRGHEAFGTIITGSQRVQSRFIRCYYRIEEQIPPYASTVGFAVRKAGNAVRRNRARRLMRESWRCRKHRLTQLCEAQQLRVSAVFLLDMRRVSGRLGFLDVDGQMEQLILDLGRIAERT